MAEKKGSSKAFMAGVGALATGSVMGLALCKSQVFRPDIIQAQLTMQNFTMLKMFLSAAMVSTVSIQSLSLGSVIQVGSSSRSWAKNMAGGALLGVAMYVTGACPGTVLAQVGPGLRSAQLTLVGGIAGAFTYGLLDPLISSFFPKPTSPDHSIDSILRISKQTAIVLMIGGFASVLGLLEYIRPWQLDSGLPLSVSTLDTLSLFSPIWSPYLGGTIIGLLQIPSFLLMNQGLGCSSGYVSLISNVLGKGFSSTKDYFKRFYGTPASIWQLFLDVGIILGAGSCYWIFGGRASTLASMPKIPALVSLLGGFLLIFGARLANGCTSGHGLTGMGKQNVGSVLAVMSMFGGGMLTALVASLLSK